MQQQISLGDVAITAAHKSRGSGTVIPAAEGTPRRVTIQPAADSSNHAITARDAWKNAGKASGQTISTSQALCYFLRPYLVLGGGGVLISCFVFYT